MRFYIYILLTMALTLSFTACSDSDDGAETPPAVTLTSIVVQSSDPELIVGTETSMSAIGLYSDGTNSDITNTVSWTSSDSAIIKMNTSIAAGIAVGTATITATDLEIAGSLELTVEQAQLTALKIVEDGLSTSVTGDFIVGETIKTKALADFDNGVTNRDVTTKVTWLAGNEDTVTVDNKGLITAIKAGTASVSISYSGEFGQAENEITGDVVAKTISKIQIFADPSSAVASAGESIRMEAWATYNDGSNLNISDTVEWSSDDKDILITENEKSISTTSDNIANGTIKAIKAEIFEDTQAVSFEKRAFSYIEIQDGYCEKGNCSVITDTTVDIPIVDDVDYDPVSIGAYYPTAWAVYTDGTKEYITSSAGIRWWSDNQAKAYVDTTRGSFVFGRGLGNAIKISVSYKGEHTTSFYVNVKEDNTTKTLQKIGIINTKLDGWGCSQSATDYGLTLKMNIGEEGKYVQACGEFLYADGTTAWEDINNNVAWTSTLHDVARVHNTTGEITALGAGGTIIKATLAEKVGSIDVLVAEKTPTHIEIQGYLPADSSNTSVITSKTLDIPIVDDVNYDPVTTGAYYPKAYLVFTDGTKEYINSTSGVRWWSSDQVSAFVDTTRGSFVFGRGLGTKIEISVSYQGEYQTSFFVNVYEDQKTKTLTRVGIKNTKDSTWGCTQNDADYGTNLTVKVGDDGKYLQTCGKFKYADETFKWEDINNNVAWFSTHEDIAKVRTTTGELISKSEGNTTITAKISGIGGDITVIVVPR